MPVEVKICGLTDEAAVKAAVASGADYAGFVHFPASPRHVGVDRIASLRALLPAHVKSVAVLVDPDDALLSQTAGAGVDFFQLHGKETPERVKAIRATYPHIKLIKAASIRASDDVVAAMRFKGIADMLMFDAKPPQLPGMLPGGNGLAFDWALLKDREFPLPWFLSGGLTPANIAAAIKGSGAAKVDVSSGVESAPGVKDPALIDAFIKAARTA